MRYVEGLKLRSWFDEHVGDGLGLNPTSSSPQPVHVLNGFLHNALSGRRMTRLAADFVSMRDGLWQVGQDELRKKAAAAGVSVPGEEKEFDTLRRAISSMVASDRAVFRQN